LLGRKNNAMQHALRKPVLTVLRWQLMATAALTLTAGALADGHGAVSAALGGSVSVVSGTVSAAVASLGKADSAGGIVIAALGAEAVKIGLIVILLWVVLTNYGDVVVAAFLGTFLATALIFAMAFFVRDA
jgi:ATP synthase protein I